MLLDEPEQILEFEFSESDIALIRLSLVELAKTLNRESPLKMQINILLDSIRNHAMQLVYDSEI